MPADTVRKEKEKKEKRDKKQDKAPVIRLEEDAPGPEEDARRVLRQKWGVKLKGAEAALPEQPERSRFESAEETIVSKVRLALVTQGSLAASNLHVKRPEKHTQPVLLDEETRKLLSSQEAVDATEEPEAGTEPSVWKKLAVDSTRRTCADVNEVKPVDLTEVESISIRPEPAAPKLGV